MWVVDSFVWEWVPRTIRLSRNIDHIFVSNPEDVDPWRARTGGSVSVLAQGADVLDLGSGRGERPVDIQRVGRQPGPWDDDVTNSAEAEALGLVYRGRPPFTTDPLENQRALAKQYSEARFTLSFSNRVDRQSYTHASREYLTFRWFDALSGGAVVAGVPPECEVVRQFLWTGALLDFKTTDRTIGLGMIKDAATSWTPAVAMHNHRNALLKIDWRWRCKEVAALFAIPTPLLDAELERLTRIAASADPLEAPEQ